MSEKESLSAEEKAAKEHNFLAEVKRQLTGIENRVLIKNGNAIIVTSIPYKFGKEKDVEVLSAFRGIAKKQETTVSSTGLLNVYFPSLKLFVPQLVAIAVFHIYEEENPVLKKGKDWKVKVSEDGSVMVLSMKSVTSFKNEGKTTSLLENYLQMISYGANKMGGDVDISLSGVLGSSMLGITLVKK